MEGFPNARFLRIARNIAATHHEKFNGSGYPQGLKEADIALCGRIVALTDVYDALTSRRVHKAAYTHDVACTADERLRGAVCCVNPAGLHVQRIFGNDSL